MIELKNRNLILVSKEKFVDDGEALVYYKAGEYNQKIS